MSTPHNSTSHRKRGVSIENVMLGLVTVLIFAGLMYGAFSYLSRKVEVNAVQEEIRMMGAEMQRLSKSMGLRALANTLSSQHDIAQYLYDSGAVNRELLQNGNLYAQLKYGGEYVFIVDRELGYFQIGVNFMEGRNGATEKFCNSIAGPTTLIGSMDDAVILDQIYAGTASIPYTSGNLGNDYSVMIKDCNADFMAVPSFAVLYNLK